MSTPLAWPYYSRCPLVGADYPSTLSELLETPEAPGFRSEMDRYGKQWTTAEPHWIYHLEHDKSGSATETGRLPSDLRAWYAKLAKFFGLAPQAHSVQQKEIEVGSVPSGALPGAFRIDPAHRLQGNSFCLAMALGLLSAEVERALPPWMVCTGALPLAGVHPSLELKSVGDMERKILICEGFFPSHNHRALMEHFYRTEPEIAEIHFGPKDARALSGKVRLLMLPTDAPWSEAELRSMRLELLDDFPDAFFGAADFAEMEEILNAKYGHDLIIARVPTVRHAARLLGFRDGPRRLREGLAPTWERDCEFYSLTPGGQEGRPARTSKEYRRYRQERAHQQLRACLGNPKLSTTKSQLEVGFRFCLEHFRADVGYLARTTSVAERLEVTAGKGMDSDYVPRDALLNRALLRELKPVRISTREELDALSGSGPAGGPPEQASLLKEWLVHERFLAGLGSVLAVPILAEGTTIGVLVLGWRREHPVSEADADLLASIVEGSVAGILRSRLEQKQLGYTHLIRKEVEQVVRNIHQTQVPYPQAVTTLGSLLAKKVMGRTRAYRVCVRLLNREETKLHVIGLSQQEEGLWPARFADREFSRNDPCACNHALNIGEHYVIEDIAKAEEDRFMRVGREPSEAGAHLAFLLRVGLKVIGVVSLDFAEEHRGDCNEALIELIEQLAGPFAAHIQQISSDLLPKELAACLPRLDRIEAEEGRSAVEWHDSLRENELLREWLTVLGTRLGVAGGSLYLRDPRDGLYRLLHEHNDSARQGELPAYGPGMGRTGWVIKHRRTLCLDDCEVNKDTVKVYRALEAQGHEITDGPHPDCWDRKTERLAYLGIPLLHEGNVLGVLRLLCRSPKHPTEKEAGPGKTRFTPLDIRFAEDATKRLTKWLVRHEQRTQERILGELAKRILSTDKISRRLDLCRAVDHALDAVLGNCNMIIRVLDMREREDGKQLEALDRIYVRHLPHELLPQFRHRSDPVALKVWTSHETYLIEDTRTDPLCLQARKECEARDPAGKDERWQQKFRSGIIAPILTHDWQFKGVLAVFRHDPQAFIRQDQHFLEELARIVGVALKRLDEEERKRINASVHTITVEYLRNRVLRHENAEHVRRTEREFVLNLRHTIRKALGAVVGRAWHRFPAGGYEALRTGEKTPHAKGIDPEGEKKLQRMFGQGALVVVSEPEKDHRLDFLVEYLPEHRRRDFSRYQKVAIRLRPPADSPLLEPALFLFMVRSPNRLSHHSVACVIQSLVATLWPQASKRPGELDSGNPSRGGVGWKPNTAS